MLTASVAVAPSRSIEHEESEFTASGTVGDQMVRRRVSLWEDTQLKDRRLMTAYRHWESLRSNGEIPPRNAFDLNSLRPIMATTSLIDVTADDPADYIIRFVGSQLPRTMNLPKHRLGDVKPEPFRDMLMRDYYACRSSGVPMYHEIAAQIDFLMTCYARLVLPFARDGRVVDQLMVCSVYTDLPHLVERL
jgi:hypothetical protein